MQPTPDDVPRYGGKEDLYSRLWASLVSTLGPVASEAATEGFDDKRKVRDSLRTWCRTADPVLQRWARPRSVVPPPLKTLPRWIDHLPPATAADLLASFSLFRLRPNRRALVWERHTNKILPTRFVEEFVEGQEAGLESGETAFAVFSAGSQFTPLRDGLVVPDGTLDLRGTHSLVDRILGLRTNCFLPIRRPGGHHDLLGMLVISFPIPEAIRLPADLLRRAGEVIRPFEELFDLLARFENSGTRVKVRDLMRATPSIHPDHLVEALVESTSLVPACAVLTCENPTGSDPPDLSVHKIRVGFARGHSAQHHLTQDELRCYGISSHSSRSHGSQTLASFGEIELSATRRDDSAGLPRSSATRLLKALARAAEAGVQAFAPSASTPGAVVSHLRMDLLRSLSHLLLASATDGSGPRAPAQPTPMQRLGAEDKFLLELECLLPLAAGRLKRLRLDLKAFQQWARRGRNGRILSIGMRRHLPVLQNDGLLGLDPPTGPSGVLPDATLRMEVEHPHGVLGWCRALLHLIDGLGDRPSDHYAGHGVVLAPADPTAAVVLPSFMGDTWTLTLSRSGKNVVVVVTSGDGSCFESRWRWQKGVVPLAASHAGRTGVTRGSSPAQIQGEWPHASQVLARLTHKTRPAAGSSPPVAASPTSRAVEELVSLLSRELPDFFASLDLVRCVPLTAEHGRDLHAWATSSGEKWLVVLGGVLPPRPGVPPTAGKEEEDTYFAELATLVASHGSELEVRRERSALDLVARHFDHELVNRPNRFEALDDVVPRDGLSAEARRRVVTALGDLRRELEVLSAEITAALQRTRAQPVSIAAIRVCLEEGVRLGRMRAVEKEQFRAEEEGRDPRTLSDVGVTLLDSKPNKGDSIMPAGPQRALVVRLISNVVGNAVFAAAPGDIVHVYLASRCIRVSNPASSTARALLERAFGPGAEPRAVEKGLRDIRALSTVLGVTPRVRSTIDRAIFELHIAPRRRTRVKRHTTK